MPLHFQTARFLASAATLSQCPPDEGVEVAFSGRSNAGKSSAINTLARQKRLARTSKTPGRTQLINFFQLDPGRRLVDLPGYGYARVPMSVREHWRRHLDIYLRRRQSLRGMVLLMDIRHPPGEFDRMMLDWSATCDMPLHILLTRADKLKRGARQKALLAARSLLHGSASVQVFSATSKLGVESLEEKLKGWMCE